MIDIKRERYELMENDRQAVYDKYNGHCAYCGCEITMKQMQVDHILPQDLIDGFIAGSRELTDDYTPIEKKACKSVRESKDMNHIDNLLPACRSCNFYKQTFHINDFRQNLEDTIWHKLEKLFNYKMLKKYGMIEECRRPVVFFFEEYGDA